MLPINDKIMPDSAFQDGEFILKHSRSQIEKAGRRIRKGTASEKDIVIIQEYRAAHDRPMRHIRSALEQFGLGQVTSRLKRFPTILDKLSRPSLDGMTSTTINVSQMSDIAGCRVIMDNYDDLVEAEIYRTDIDGAIVKRTRDYLIAPKTTGYRGIHRIYSCGGFDVEVQFRTKLQHVWSTAIEIVDLFEGTKLKTSPQQADPRWLEFFRLFSEILYCKDAGIVTAELPGNINALRALESELSVYTKLMSFTISSPHILDDYTGIDSAVISVTPAGKVMQVDTVLFTEFEKLDAMALYQQNEAKGLTTIMVNVGDFSKLQEAYPAYQIDISQFTTELLKIVQ
ncbi:hypothetical protein SB6421_03233 [Klebsiella huaxiensis]|uniref:RelA/SpoT domain-containing protein n=1 Tax=Klebsiella huaxiensis TaxID=2153354 RepID=UPI0011587AFF|nr:RelA/SpoT domain-containing protein [Klebsiella huaxiensis]VUS72919.1 hypothetical protein SB6421_03233 [Klebsiella huaxiensis]